MRYHLRHARLRLRRYDADITPPLSLSLIRHISIAIIIDAAAASIGFSLMPSTV